LPKVDDVLASEELRALATRAPRWAVVTAVQAEIARLRAAIVAAESASVVIDANKVAAKVAELLEPSLQPVVNATGVVLHTNLGRAPLARSAIERIEGVARGYVNLEYKLDARRRGSRHEHLTRLLCALTGAEDELVVNNCAAAVLLALSELARGKKVIVSRGELVEIGGSFRVPDVMRQSGATLVEVGTTNRTHLSDYQAAVDSLGGDTALLLKVHRSNFAVIGFTAEVEVHELAALGRARGIPVMVDLGSGALADVRALRLGDEPTVPKVIAAGADVVTFSGDKLLGGPQAGILVGKSALIEKMRAHPLLRALRPDKLTLAALEATLELYRDGKSAEVPTVAMLSATEPTLKARAEKLAELCQAAAPSLAFTPARVRSAVGGGALPLAEPWSWAVSVSGASPTALDEKLRRARPPVVARIADDRLLLDVRTLFEEDWPKIVRAFGCEDREP
jgi:L-seryl-tRNA(Ser) seleniumtransferase